MPAWRPWSWSAPEPEKPVSRESRTIRIKVSPEVAKIAAPAAPRELKLSAARGEQSLEGRDLLTTLLFLAHGRDPEVRAAALSTLGDLPRGELLTVAGDAETHPQLLDFLARHRKDDPELRAAILANPAAGAELRQRLGDVPTAEAASPATGEQTGEQTVEQTGEDEAEDEEAQIPEEEQVNQSKYQQALELGVAEKIKFAMTGDKEWRSIFLKDANKLVSSAALKNPRITDGEVLAVAKNKSSSDELIRLITLNRDWLKSYEIKKALVMHPKTPLPKALRFMNILTEKDIKALAKSRNVPQVLANNARRMLMAKEKKS